jgi:hypothetical protein
VHQIPFLLPIAQASPTGHPRSGSQFLRQHLPRNPAAQHEKDAGETGTIRDARPSTARSRQWNGEKRAMRSNASGNRTAAISRRRYRAPRNASMLSSGRFCYALID